MFLRGGCLCQRIVTEFLSSSKLHKLRAVPNYLGEASFHFHKTMALLPSFCLHKPWLTESSGAYQTFTYHGGVHFQLFTILSLLEVVIIPALFEIIKITSEVKLASLNTR